MNRFRFALLSLTITGALTCGLVYAQSPAPAPPGPGRGGFPGQPGMPGAPGSTDLFAR